MDEKDFIIEGDVLVAYNGNDPDIVMPVAVKKIAKGAFKENKTIVNVDLANVEEIGDEVFLSCDKLERIIAENVISIGSKAFSNCYKLRHVKFGKVERVGSGAFMQCWHLTKIEGCGSLFYIGESAFDGCGDLTELKLGPHAEYIGAGAFRRCAKLREFTVPNGITEIKDCMFCGCELLRSVTLPEGVKKIEINSFFECDALRRITIPSTVEMIEPSAFARCHVVEVHNYSPLNIAAGKGSHGDVARYAIAVYTRENDRESEIIDDYVFCVHQKTNVAYLIEYLGNETELTLPRDYHGDGYEIIRLAFAELDITSVDLGDGVTAIGNLAFYDCKNLHTVKFGNGLRRIDKLAFKLCKKLQALELGDGVEILGSGAFAHTGIKYIVIGRGIEAIRSNVFYGCMNLKNIYFADTVDDMIARWGYDYTSYWFTDNVAFYSEKKPTDNEHRYWHYAGGRPRAYSR